MVGAFAQNPARIPRGTTASITARVLLTGEMVYNTDTGNFHVGDGVTLGGKRFNDSEPLSPVSVAGATYTVLSTDRDLVFTGTGCTVTLPSAAAFPGRELFLRSTAPAFIVSGAANVVPLVGGAATAAILFPVDGAWVRLVSDGTDWLIAQQWPAPGEPITLAQSAVAVSHTGDLNLTALATISIPAGLMGANGRVEIDWVVSYTNSANNKIFQVRLGGLGGTLFHNRLHTTSVSSGEFTRIANRNSQASQVSFASGGYGYDAAAAAVATGAVNTALAQTIVIAGLLGSAGETVTLESYRVVVFHKP